MESLCSWITNSSPAIGSDGSIYIGGNDGHLYVFNKNGELKWSFFVSNNIAVGPPTLDSKGIVYFGTKDFNNNQINMFYALEVGRILALLIARGLDCITTTETQILYRSIPSPHPRLISERSTRAKQNS